MSSIATGTATCLCVETATPVGRLRGPDANPGAPLAALVAGVASASGASPIRCLLAAEAAGVAVAWPVPAVRGAERALEASAGAPAPVLAAGPGRGVALPAPLAAVEPCGAGRLWPATATPLDALDVSAGPVAGAAKPAVVSADPCTLDAVPGAVPEEDAWLVPAPIGRAADDDDDDDDEPLCAVDAAPLPLACPAAWAGVRLLPRVTPMSSSSGSAKDTLAPGVLAVAMFWLAFFAADCSPESASARLELLEAAWALAGTDCPRLPDADFWAELNSRTKAVSAAVPGLTATPALALAADPFEAAAGDLRALGLRSAATNCSGVALVVVDAVAFRLS